MTEQKIAYQEAENYVKHNKDEQGNHFTFFIQSWFNPATKKTKQFQTKTRTSGTPKQTDTETETQFMFVDRVAVALQEMHCPTLSAIPT